MDKTQVKEKLVVMKVEVDIIGIITDRVFDADSFDTSNNACRDQQN